MTVEFDFTDHVAVVTGSCGALGSAVVTEFVESGATVAACDIVDIDSEDSLLDPQEGVSFYQANLGTVRANCVMPSVLDTPMNREMMTPKDEWVDPSQVAHVMQFLCSDAAEVTSGAAVPVYGEA